MDRNTFSQHSKLQISALAVALSAVMAPIGVAAAAGAPASITPTSQTNKTDALSVAVPYAATSAPAVQAVKIAYVSLSNQDNLSRANLQPDDPQRTIYGEANSFVSPVTLTEDKASGQSVQTGPSAKLDAHKSAGLAGAQDPLVHDVLDSVLDAKGQRLNPSVAAAKKAKDTEKAAALTKEDEAHSKLNEQALSAHGAGLAGVAEADGANGATVTNAADDQDAQDDQGALDRTLSLADFKDRAVSDIMQSVWPDKEAETTDSLDYRGQAVDPFAQKQSSWIEFLLGGAISQAQASGKMPSFNYFSSVNATSAREISSEVQLRELWAPTQFRLKSGALLENSEFKRDYMQTLDRGFSYISYLFHQNNPYRSRYNIPVVFLNESGASRLWWAHNAFSPFKIESNKDRVWGNYPTLILDRRYNSGLCQGLGVLEADLLGKCQAENRDDMRLGVIVVPSMSGFVVNEGIYTGVIRHIAPNVMQVNILASGVAFAARLAGVASNLIIPQHKGGVSSFPDKLGNFERHLYSQKLQDFVRPGQKFTDIAPDCRLTNQKACALYFVGEDVQRILGKHAGAAFSLGTPVSLPELSSEELSYYKVALDRFGSGLYTISSIDLAQIRKAQQLRKIAEEEEVEDEDAAAVESLKKTSNNEIAVEVEPASLETSETVAAAAQAATLSVGGDAVINYVSQASGGNKAIPNTQVSESEAEAELTGDPSLALIDEEQGQSNQQANDESQKRGVSVNVANVLAESMGAKASKDRVDAKAQAKLAAATQELNQSQVQGHAQGQTPSQMGKDFDKKLMVSPDKLKTDSFQVQYGIPVYFNELGQPVFDLRNTLLSYSDYKNYNFLTEVEMMVLSDLGYSIESAEFYGNSVYAQGSQDQRLLHKITQGFGLYDHKTKTYNIKKPAAVPSAVGLHVYGDYNDLVQSSTFNLAGVGSIGVRIDGCDNYYYQQSDSVIESSGVEGSGIAFTYGKNNSAYIGGKVTALGSKGVAIRADMGSNVNSDLIEYRGSYIRARSLDYQEGRLSLQEASTVPLLDEINGPQVKDLTISGQVEGSRAAIFIDESSLVRNINLSSKAKITGGIYSTWNPSVDGSGNVRVKHDSKRSQLVDAIIQYPERDPRETKRELAARELTTRLNLGVQLDAEHQVIFADGKDNGRCDEVLVGDPKSRTVLNGSVNGGSIRIQQFGGKTTINGDVRAYSIDVFEGVLRLNPPQDGAINQLNHLRLMPDSVLDLVDGKGSQTYVQEEAIFGRNSVVRVDVDAEGNILDELNYMGQLYADDSQIRLEPAVRYDTLKSLATNPKTMLAFISNFMQKSDEKFAQASVSLRFPKYIWDSAGSYGRELKCSARGCRIGGFVSNEVVSKFDNVQPWRYYLAFSGLLLFFIAFYAAYFVKRLKTKVKI